MRHNSALHFHKYYNEPESGMEKMLDSVIFCENRTICDEIKDIVNRVPLLSAHTISDVKQQKQFIEQNSVQFLIHAHDSNIILDKSLKLYRKYPHIQLIYYYPNLKIDHIRFGEFDSFSHIVVGENRKANLLEILLQLTTSYWKKIPYNKFGFIYDDLSPRLRGVMNYIETHELKSCSTSQLARHLDISAGYFSQQFKRETGMTFRRFMQMLLDHYEYVIFDRLKLSAKTASKILGYSDLSSFSRSFKKRKGYPPSRRSSSPVKIKSPAKSDF